MDGVRCVLDARSILGEGALWDAQAAGPLNWVDIKWCEIHRFDPRAEPARTPAGRRREDVGSVAVRAAGGLVVAMTSWVLSV